MEVADVVSWIIVVALVSIPVGVAVDQWQNRKVSYRGWQISKLPRDYGKGRWCARRSMTLLEALDPHKVCTKPIECRAPASSSACFDPYCDRCPWLRFRTRDLHQVLQGLERGIQRRTKAELYAAIDEWIENVQS